MSTEPEFYGMRLQPRPDPQTGLPRPKFVSMRPLPEKKGKALEPPTRPPPPGRGPALDWTYSSRRDAAGGGLFVSLVIAFIASTFTGGFGWMSNPLYWIIFASLMAWTASYGDSYDSEVGADWYRVGDTWIDLYDIVEVIVRSGSTTREYKIMDSHNRCMKIDVLRIDRQIWSFIRNGIEHSVVGGAYMNRAAEKHLSMRQVKSRPRRR